MAFIAANGFALALRKILQFFCSSNAHRRLALFGKALCSRLRIERKNCSLREAAHGICEIEGMGEEISVILLHLSQSENVCIMNYGA
jgi:hypothetical protein